MNLKIERASQYGTIENVKNQTYTVCPMNPEQFKNSVSSGYNRLPFTLPHTILTVKQWKYRHVYDLVVKAEYEKANAMTQKIENLKREVNNDLEKFFEANGIDKIDSDEYDKL
jgi:hypothetical protein